MRKLWLLPLLALLAGCAGGTEKKEEHVRYVKCDTVRLAGSPLTESRFPGRVKASSEADVAFRVAGQIARISVVQGQFVKKGMEIARLDDRDYCIQLSATEAEYNSVMSESRRVMELYEKKSVTPNEHDKAVFGLKQMTAKLEAHRNALFYTRLVAPFDGYVQKKLFNVGESVSAGMAVVSIVSADSPEIEIHLPTADYIRREHYTGATASIDVFPDKVFALELIGINRKANLNQLYTANFRIKDPLQVSPGMTAMVTIQSDATGKQWMQIPFTALAGDSVWIASQGVATRKPIKVKEIKNNGTALVEGLNEGELIISRGINSLKEGQPVKALPASSATNEGGVL